ncbi:hypothetical protein R1sor_017873 [Riccia sorocarpa]|uniref:Pentatricopeptide repeat-containing protein n=1 Tax=Riccia sorocarpa TaxID=122646 RepID=A0ABD3IC35_9MARC
MFRCLGALRNFGRARTIAVGAPNCLLAKDFPLKVDYYNASAFRLRDDSLDRNRYVNGRPSQRHIFQPDQGQERKSFSYKEQNSSLEIRAGGGPRPRKPRVWKTKTRRGSIAKSEKLIEVVHKLSNVKEEIYNTLDAFIAWDLEFPLIAVKKGLKTLAENGEWRRVIQVTKWMLDKGQGKTLATYLMLLEALDNEGRIEEAKVLWEKVLQENMECIPRAMFARMISMYERYGKPKELLQVFADMEELRVKPDMGTLQRVSKTYAQFGYPEYAEALFRKYPMEEDGTDQKGKHPYSRAVRDDKGKTSAVKGSSRSESSRVEESISKTNPLAAKLRRATDSLQARIFAA